MLQILQLVLLFALASKEGMAATIKAAGSDSCDTSFAELNSLKNGAIAADAAKKYLHVQPSAKSASSLLAEKRLQEALWVAAENGEAELAKKIRTQIKETLLHGKIISRQRVPLSADGAEIVTFENGVKAVFKSDDGYQGPHHEVAAYLLDQELGLNLVPMTVWRKDDIQGSIQLWVPNALSRTKGSAKDPQYVEGVLPTRLNLLGLFDRLISNFDRNGYNYLVTRDTRRLIAIDHTRSISEIWKGEGFSPTTDITSVPDDLEFLAALEALSPERIKTTLSGLVDEKSIDQLIQRRQKLIQVLREKKWPNSNW